MLQDFLQQHRLIGLPKWKYVPWDVTLWFSQDKLGTGLSEKWRGGGLHPPEEIAAMTIGMPIMVMHYQPIEKYSENPATKTIQRVRSSIHCFHLVDIIFNIQIMMKISDNLLLWISWTACFYLCYNLYCSLLLTNSFLELFNRHCIA